MKAVSALLLHWFSFRGRIGRADFNSVNMVAMLLFVAANMVFVSPLFSMTISGPVTISAIPLGWNALVGGVLAAAALLMAMSSAVRRLHDFGWSGWWLALTLSPLPGFRLFAGLLGILLLGVFRGNPGDNSFGKSVRSPSPLI